ncbi:MAG: hypothetical protein APF80_10085 [Alphaproteobacteria bacterium BRH_c36]|nr:MAG: hypothetical protein APF80_10085 [Alphaproteobacteria bacterium BRH_c36]
MTAALDTVLILLPIVLLAAALRLSLLTRQQRCLLRQRLNLGTDAANPDYRGIDTALARLDLERIETVAETAILSASVIFLIPIIDAYGRSWGVPSIWLAVGAVGMVLGSQGLLWLFLRARSVYAIDAASGAGTPTVGLFMKDATTALLFSAAFIVPVVAATASMMETGHPAWWIGAWMTWVIIMALRELARPLVLALLTYRSRMLDDRELSQNLNDLLARCGLPRAHIEVLDASRRSRRANASVHGIGAVKRIFVHDTLLALLSRPETVAVIAHELGHARLRHHEQYLARSAATGLLAFLALAVAGEWLGATIPAQLANLTAVLPAIGFLMRPIAIGVRHRWEYEADAFAARHADVEALGRALERLHNVNIAPPQPDPLYAAFHHFHPDLRGRLSRLDTITRIDSRADQDAAETCTAPGRACR